MIDSDRPRLVTRFTLSTDGLARGLAFDPDDPAARFVVEILADGLPIALLRAEEPDADPAAPLGNDGCYAFSVPVEDEVAASIGRLSARLANSDILIGTVDMRGRSTGRGTAPEAEGHVQWAGGLRLSGHVARAAEPDRVPVVRALIDGTEVARAACSVWCQLDGGRVARAFDLRLPERYADGRVRPVEVLTDNVGELPGSPCLVVAYPDTLADCIDGWADLESEKVRARFADGLLPRSSAIDTFDDWLLRFPLPRPAPTAPRRIAVAIVGATGLDATIASLEAQEGVAWSAAALTGGASRIGFDPRHLRSFLDEDAADCDLLVMAVSGSVLAPQALGLMLEAADRWPDAAALYPDLVVATATGERWPLALPAYDDELFLEQAYCGLVYAVRRDVVLGSAADRPTLFKLFPADDRPPPWSAPVHLAAPLATVPEDLPPDDVGTALLDATRARLAARGVDASVTLRKAGSRPSVRVRRRPPPGDVTVVIAVRDDGPALARTLASLRNTATAARLRIILADSGSTDPETRDTLGEAARQGAAVLDVPGWHCVPQLLNRAAAVALGEFLLFWECGLTPLDADWLDEMLGRIAGRAVGAVGGLVVRTTGMVRDAGLALGPRLSAMPRFTDRLVGDEGYAGLLGAAHACSALSASCLLTPRRLFAANDGFDVPRFPLGLFAPDYCLRLREAGQRIVFTPHAGFRIDSDAKLPAEQSAFASLAERERAVFRHRWSMAPGCDPFYSPWMSMDGPPYSGLAWPPAPYEPRRPDRPVSRRLPNGF